MSIQLREKILNDIMIEVEKTKGNMTEYGAKLVDAYFNTISEDISAAIGTVDDLSAPFIVAALEMYSDKLKKEFHGISLKVKWIKKLPNILIKKRIK